MKRPLFVIGFCVLLSSAAALLFGDNFALSVSVLLALAAPAAFFLVKRHRGAAVAVLLSAAAGLSMVLLQNILLVRPVRQLEEKTVYLEGRITEVSFYENSSRYKLSARIPMRDGTVLQTKVSIYSATPIAARVNEVIGGYVALRGTDISGEYRFYNLSERMLLTGVFEGTVSFFPGKGESYGAGYHVTRLREHITEQNRRLLLPRSANIVNAMLLGEKGQVSQEIMQDFQRSGLVHLMSVSGFHLSLITAVLLFCFGAIGIPRRACVLLTLPCMLLFMAVCGFSPSVLRSGLMMGLCLVAMLIGERPDALNSLGFAVLVICLVNPYSALNMGLQLSVASTMGIVVLSPGIYKFLCGKIWRDTAGEGHRVSRTLLRSFSVSLSAYVLALPIMLFGFDTFSVVAPIASVFVMPLATLLLWSACAALCVSAVAPLFPIARIISLLTELLAGAVGALAHGFATFPGSAIATGDGFLPIFVLGCYLGALALIITKASGKTRRFCATLALTVLLAGGTASFLLNMDTVKLMTFRDSEVTAIVRGSEAAVLGFPKKPAEGSRIATQLEGAGVKRLDIAVNTAETNEDVLGARELFSKFPPGRVIMPGTGPETEHILRTIPSTSPIRTPSELSAETLGITLKIMPCSCGCFAVLDFAGPNILKINENCVIMDYDSQTFGVIRGGEPMDERIPAGGSVKTATRGDGTITYTLRGGKG